MENNTEKPNISEKVERICEELKNYSYKDNSHYEISMFLGSYAQMLSDLAADELSEGAVEKLREMLKDREDGARNWETTIRNRNRATGCPLCKMKKQGSE